MCLISLPYSSSSKVARSPRLHSYADRKVGPAQQLGQWNTPLPNLKANSPLVRRVRIDSEADAQTIVAALPDVASTACLCSGVLHLFIKFPRILYRDFGQVAGLFLDIVRSMPELGTLAFDAHPVLDPPDNLDLCQPMRAGPMNSILEIAPCTLHTLVFGGYEPIQDAQLARFRNLKILVLPSIQRIDAALLQTLQTHCPCLTTLHVEAVYPPLLEWVLVAGTFTAGLLNLLPRLRYLSLPQRHLPPSDVEAIISRALTSANMQELRLFNCLFDTIYDESSNPNTLIPIQHILRRTPSPHLSSTPLSLAHLDFTGVPLSLDTYNTLSSGYLPKLKLLRIGASCGAIRDHHFEGFLYHAPHLTDLFFEDYHMSEVTEVPLITVATLACIARYGGALRTCCIRAKAIDDTATFDHVVAIVETSPELEELCLGKSDRPEMAVGLVWNDDLWNDYPEYDLEWMRSDCRRLIQFPALPFHRRHRRA
ncbi:hypothetical protein HK104_006485 [Borealophlyctis nickersoniae]|nr:hypothetical protein HK104_006485 [Borealophlyctis nickersoniae]